MPERKADLIVSACLLGQACRYDGASKGKANVQALASAIEAAGGWVVAVCRCESSGSPACP